MVTDIMEQTRVMSLLSEQYHVIEMGQKRYACYAGIVLPLDVAQGVVLWTMIGAKYYHNIFINRVDEIRQLNFQNTDLILAADTSSLPEYLKRKLESIMAGWKPHHFQGVLDY